MLRHRSEEALRRKARRGELFLTVAVGYVRVGRDEVGMDPDRRVQEAIALSCIPSFCKHQITPKTSRYTRCSMSMFCGPVAKAPDKPPAPYRQRASLSTLL